MAAFVCWEHWEAVHLRSCYGKKRRDAPQEGSRRAAAPPVETVTQRASPAPTLQGTGPEMNSFSLLITWAECLPFLTLSFLWESEWDFHILRGRWEPNFLIQLLWGASVGTRMQVTGKSSSISRHFKLRLPITLVKVANTKNSNEKDK